MTEGKKTSATDFNASAEMPYPGMISDSIPNPTPKKEIGRIAPDGQPWRKYFSSKEDAIENAHAFAHNRI